MRRLQEFIDWVTFKGQLGNPPTLEEVYEYLVDPLKELPEDLPLKFAQPHPAHGRYTPLTAKEVNEMRRIWAASKGSMTLVELARRFKISDVMAHNIVKNKSYRVG